MREYDADYPRRWTKGVVRLGKFEPRISSQELDIDIKSRIAGHHRNREVEDIAGEDKI